MAEKKVLVYDEIDTVAITDWCIANNQLKWLTAATAKREFPVYEKVAYTKKDGTTGYKSNTDKIVGTEMRLANPFELRKEFAMKFMPEIIPEPKKTKPVTLQDLVAAAGTPEYETVKAAYQKEQEKSRAAAQRAKERRKAKKEAATQEETVEE